MLIVSTSGSGHVSAENQLDLTPDVSGAVTKVFVKEGQEVKAGDPIIQIDNRDALKTVRSAQQSVRDAQISLESAQIAYEKLIKPQSQTSVLQAQYLLNQSQRALQDLLDGPAELDVLRAEESVRTAELNAKLADDGVTPKVVRDEYDKAVATLQNLLNSAENYLDDANDVLAVDGYVSNMYMSQLFSGLDQG